MKRVLVIGLILALAPFALSAAEQPKKGGSLIVCVGDEPPALTPRLLPRLRSIGWSTRTFMRG